jgi:hypothetical protein
MSDTEIPEGMPGNMTDGFYRVVKALKLNGIDAIFGPVSRSRICGT